MTRTEIQTETECYKLQPGPPAVDKALEGRKRRDYDHNASQLRRGTTIMKKPALHFLLLLAASTAFGAEPRQFGDWVVNLTSDKSRIYAATVNDSGSILGEYCDLSTHTCNWLLGMDSSCDDAGPIPALGDTASGAIALNLKCGGKIGSGNIYQYFFANWKDVELLLKDSSLVGFAFPMADGKFKVSRFSLTGRTDAMALAESVAFTMPESAPKPKPVQTGTSDTTL